MSVNPQVPGHNFVASIRRGGWPGGWQESSKYYRRRSLNERVLDDAAAGMVAKSRIWMFAGFFRRVIYIMYLVLLLVALLVYNQEYDLAVIVQVPDVGEDNLDQKDWM